MAKLRQKNARADRGRERDKAHMGNIARLPCIVCNRAAPSEVAHIRLGDLAYGVEHVGMAVKPHDFLTVPLCPDHHRLGRRAEHRIGSRPFWKMVGINPVEVALRLYQATSHSERMAVLFDLQLKGLKDPNHV